MLKKQRYEAFIQHFSENMPVAETELEYDNPFQLLVAVVLSAQCTDKRVNIVTRELSNTFQRLHIWLQQTLMNFFLTYEPSPTQTTRPST